jgi:nicotinamidase-related amidase
MQGAKARNVPIVRILHEDADGNFSRASGLVKPMDFLPETHDVEFTKQAHNAFTTTGLQRWLIERDVNHLIISGIRTEQCCETTTRVASDLGYAVDYVTEATLTFPMTHPVTGRRFETAELKEKTELVLHNRFARIVTVEECLRGLDD